MPEPEPRSTLLRSQLQCPLCGDLIASIHRHDFQTCKCGALSIDGGRDYLRVAYSDKLGPSLDMQAMNRSISIDGEHNNASAAAALEVYKCLWEASDHGNRPASGAAVHRHAVNRGNRHKMTARAVLAYLKCLTEGENAPVEGSARSWKPLIPLAERPDAP